MRSPEQILHELDSIRELQTVPQILDEILQAIADPKTNMDKIADLILHDQVLTVAVLKLVNSSYFSLSKEVTSLRHGIVLLGLKKIRDVILTTVLLNHFQLDSTMLNRNHFWAHALGCAKGASYLEPANTDTPGDLFYVAGLIHDIGEIILAQFFTDEFRLVYETAQKNSLSLYQAETEILGVTHCDIGEQFGRRWNFPEAVIQTIKYHHTPIQADKDELIVSVIHLSDLFARLMGLNYNVQEALLISFEDQPAFKILKKYNPALEKMDWGRFSLELTEQFKQIFDSVNVYFDTN